MRENAREICYRAKELTEVERKKLYDKQMKA